LRFADGCGDAFELVDCERDALARRHALERQGDPGRPSLAGTEQLVFAFKRGQQSGAQERREADVVFLTYEVVREA
jgi:hypothetical protein